MAFDSRFSRIRRSLPRSAISGQVLDLHIQPHALRDQRQLLVLEHLLDQRPQRGTRVSSRPTLLLCQALKLQQVLDHALQLDAVLLQDRRDLALPGVAARRPRRPSAARCPRGYWPAASSVRATCGAGSGCAPAPAPAAGCAATRAARPGVRRSTGPLTAIGRENVAAAQLGDGAVDLAQRPPDAQREHERRRPAPAAPAAPIPRTAARRARVGLVLAAMRSSVSICWLRELGDARCLHRPARSSRAVADAGGARLPGAGGAAARALAMSCCRRGDGIEAPLASALRSRARSSRTRAAEGGVVLDEGVEQLVACPAPGRAAPRARARRSARTCSASGAWSARPPAPAAGWLR